MLKLLSVELVWMPEEPNEELLLFAPLKSRKPPPCETCSSMVAEKVFESWSLVTTWMEMSLATSMATGYQGRIWLRLMSESLSSVISL